ncbi:MAG TPA: neutral zinc metallopeptidase [Anaeromyxobacteraceae bacterium]|nr:neutral zinc metallopeptidase [Anaeromyxobacteraceae bacterium]
MRLGDDDRSDVEDRRGLSLGGTGVRLGLGGTLVLVVLSLVFKTDLLSTVVGGSPAQPAAPQAISQRKAGERDLEEVAVRAFNDAQDFWSSEFRQRRESYPDAKLVLFWDGTRSGCGDASAAMGPFYCPEDRRVYIDLGFYRELARRFGAPGQFAQAYVLAHEVGHHVQDVIGLERRVRAAQQRDPSARNELSVRLELQADCLAGVWARSAQERGLLDPGDLDQGLAAAAAVGDDRIQRATTGAVHPERFTHGTAAQRAHWFREGFDRGTVDGCDTFRSAADEGVGSGRPDGR